MNCALISRKLCLLIFVGMLVSGCGQNLTEKLQSIGPGQSVDSVRTLLGEPNSIVQAKSNTGLNGMAYVYKTPKGDVQVVLINDRVYHIYMPGELTTSANPAPSPTPSPSVTPGAE
jgi:hypothetical protein